MSAAAANSTDADLVADAVRSGTIGFSMLVARRLLSPDKPRFLDLLLQAFAAGIVAVVVGWAAKDYVQSKNLLNAILGISGAFAPELVGFAMRWLNARAEAKVREEEAKVAAQPPAVPHDAHHHSHRPHRRPRKGGRGGRGRRG